jgi:hypothetical protein
MAHYALINSNNLVVQVITGVDENTTQTDIDGSIVGGSAEAWEHFYQNQPQHTGLLCKRTSYNGNIRNKYAGVGDIYDAQNDVFIEPLPFVGWVLNTQFQWEPPHPKPNTGKKYIWNNELIDWVEMPWIDQLDDAGNNP